MIGIHSTASQLRWQHNGTTYSAVRAVQVSHRGTARGLALAVHYIRVSYIKEIDVGREVRRVPKDWIHPKVDLYGRHDYQPMHDEPFGPAMDEWYADWKAHKPEEHDGLPYWEYSGGPPDPAYYRPDWPEASRTHLMMYEDTSEGTPISPAFETPEKLARWLADNGASAFGSSTATYEQWLATCKGAWAPSMVIENGVMKSGVEFAAQQR